MKSRISVIRLVVIVIAVIVAVVAVDVAAAAAAAVVAVVVVVIARCLFAVAASELLLCIGLGSLTCSFSLPPSSLANCCCA